MNNARQRPPLLLNYWPMDSNPLMYIQVSMLNDYDVESSYPSRTDQITLDIILDRICLQQMASS